ncbi:L-threonylcarbamoyladenylate synthase [Nevskia soli]|uniref:L-threonylcarbamoyladenylate synthase n=1 Tax=Nevskia soli TaxID=418856 RepID=UPI0015D6DE0A|nr:L-threonylcarbamoyladenylate synthase [Nevskia soli]
MATDLIEIDPKNPAESAIDRAVDAIQRGQVIAVPTESLYTLMGDPMNLQAVTQVFQAKGRESVRSLPLLVADTLMVEDLARELSKRFYVLARKFWPGPLSIILPASSKVPLKVTGNTGRLAVRQSAAVIAQQIVTRMNQPVIATSANISGQPTLTSGIEVFATLDGRVDLVLDGGVCSGAGSSTVDITEPYWRMIREGAIPEKEIAESLKGL